MDDAFDRMIRRQVMADLFNVDREAELENYKDMLADIVRDGLRRFCERQREAGNVLPRV